MVSMLSGSDIFVFHITRFTVNTWLQILMKICERCSDEQVARTRRLSSFWMSPTFWSQVSWKE